MSGFFKNSLQVRGLVGSSILAIVILSIGFGFYAFGESWQERIVYSAFVNLIIVVGVQVFMGNANITIFSHSAFMGIAAYAAAICVTPAAMKAISLPDAPWGINAFQLSVFSSVAIALLITLAFAVFTGLFISRLSSIGVVIVSIALLVIVHSIFLYRTDIFKGNQAFFGIPKILSLPAITIIAVFIVFLARMFRESRIGIQLRATADDEIGARAMGVNIVKVRFIAWVASAMFLAIGGICYALYLGTISARPFYFHYVFLTVAMLILGGLRTVTGAVMGTFLITFGLQIMRWLETGPTVFGAKLPQMLGLSGLILGIVIVFTMMFKPSGIMGNHEIEDVFLKKKSSNIRR